MKKPIKWYYHKNMAEIGYFVARKMGGNINVYYKHLNMLCNMGWNLYGEPYYGKNNHLIGTTVYLWDITWRTPLNFILQFFLVRFYEYYLNDKRTKIGLVYWVVPFTGWSKKSKTIGKIKKITFRT